MKQILSALFVLATSHIAFGADLTATEVFAKCHARLTNHPVNIDSNLYKQVAEGKKDPVQACMDLMERARFKASGGVRKLEKENDAIALGIVENFQSFHRSWFTSGNIDGGGVERFLYSLVDFSAPALYITDALFSERHYQSVFRRTDGIRGVRRSESSSGYYLNNTRIDNVQLISGPITGGNNATEVDNVAVLSGPRVSQGRLVGVTGQPAVNMQSPRSLYRETYQDSFVNSNVDDRAQENVAEFFGGGILGAPSYVLSNSESNARLDGGVRIHRRLANSTLYDLMCLNLPNLREDQVQAYMNKYKDSELSFRQDKSCARCHATLDPFADTFRNIQVHLGASTTFLRNFRDEKHPEFPNANRVRFLKHYKVRLNQQVADDTDLAYRRRRPVGKLFYNSVNGKTVNVNVNGVQDLGVKMSNQLDPYVCASQHYYGFLTGVKINVNSGETSDFYKNHRKEIVRLGRKLKEDGSLLNLIEEILKTDAFQTRFPGYEITQGGE